jgi:hypothetical protein
MLKRNMKATLRFSILLNLALLGGLAVVLTNQRQKESAPVPVLSETKPPAPVPATSVAPAPSDTEPAPFRWGQLMSAKDYRVYIANLRAIGCPEATLEDIVRGDTDRVFSWERRELRLDGSGAGPWSRLRERHLVASLLSDQAQAETAETQGAENAKAQNNGSEIAQVPVPSQDTGAGTPSYPLFLQNANWRGLGFTPEQQAAIAQVRQQFQSEIKGVNQSSDGTVSQNAGTSDQAGTPSQLSANDTAALTRWQTTLQNADNQLQALLGAQGYAAYEQQQYYAWYQPQVLANAGGGNLVINPEAFSPK